MPEDVPTETIEKQIDSAILAVTAAQSDSLSKEISRYYKAGSNAVRDTSRLTNVQKNAIKRLSAEHFGHISEFNNVVAEQIKEKARDIIAEGKGHADVSATVKEYAQDQFSGSEKVVIDNTGKTRTIFKVGKDGTIRKTTKVIERPYVTNVKAYSDMLGRTATHTAWEQGRSSEYQRLGLNFWKYISALDERTRPDHMALAGRVFEFGTEQSDMAEAIMSEPRCRCRKIPYYDDPELDSPQEVFEEQKRKAGLQWDEEKEEWSFA